MTSTKTPPCSYFPRSDRRVPEFALGRERQRGGVSESGSRPAPNKTFSPVSLERLKRKYRSACGSLQSLISRGCEFAGKPAPYPGVGRGGPLQTGRWRFDKQKNLPHKACRRKTPHPPARVLTVYTEAFTGSDTCTIHVVSAALYSLKAMSLKRLWCGESGQRARSEDPGGARSPPRPGAIASPR